MDDTQRDTASAQPFYKKIARHYEESGALEEAERFYKKAGQPQKAVREGCLCVGVGWVRGGAERRCVRARGKAFVCVCSLRCGGA